MTVARTLAPVMCMALMTTAATAQTGTPVDLASASPEARMNMAVTAHVFDYFVEFEGLLEVADVFSLSLIAKMKALSMTCEGFDLDRVRYTAAIGDVIGPLYRISADGEQPMHSGNPLVTIAMSGYSMLVGGNLAVAAYNPDGFCAAGEELRAHLIEDNATHLLIWADRD